MKVDIGIERTRHLGARWLLDQGIPFAAPAARKPLRFLGGDKAFVEAHLAVLTDLDVHTAALALARMGMIPRPEPRSEERRVGKACVSPCRSRWSPYP